MEFPIDSLYPYHMVNKEVGAKNKGKGLVQKIVNWYVHFFLLSSICSGVVHAL